ncbi:hypothetical protein CCYA_CCYA17G4384 [Cyanidiococcus yangmingshanensis]|nr:hypothetical protein CCYA_CCYA17G4384 [Cyanidiococcus yangmingshanensis]
MDDDDDPWTRECHAWTRVEHRRRHGLHRADRALSERARALGFTNRRRSTTDALIRFRTTLADQIDQVDDLSQRVLKRIGVHNIKRFVCLGIGSFVTEPRAQWQLAWALTVRQHLLEHTTSSQTIPCFLIEPSLSVEEVRLAGEFGFQVFRGDSSGSIYCCRCHDEFEDGSAEAVRVARNHHGPRSALPHSTAFHEWIRPTLGISGAELGPDDETLIFMPHCGIGLVELILELFWEELALPRLHLVSNDLNEMLDTQQATLARVVPKSKLQNGAHSFLQSSAAANIGKRDHLDDMVDGDCISISCVFHAVTQRCVQWLATLDPGGCRNPGLRCAAFHGLGWQRFGQVQAAVEATRALRQQDVEEAALCTKDAHYIPI